jgi:hypothetical protein
VLRNIGQGIGILVSKFPKETAASYSLREPDEVRRIHRLSPAALLSRATVDWKANQHKFDNIGMTENQLRQVIRQEVEQWNTAWRAQTPVQALQPS